MITVAPPLTDVGVDVSAALGAGVAVRVAAGIGVAIAVGEELDADVAVGLAVVSIGVLVGGVVGEALPAVAASVGA